MARPHTRELLRPASLLGALALGSASGCDDGARSHEYVAMAYEPATACLDPSAALDVIDTPDGPLDCPPVCLAATTPSGPARVYVSTMCGPQPSWVDSSGSDPACAPALAAYASGCTCDPPGQSSCAGAPGDGGAD